MNTITMICWKRPEYLKRAIESILLNPRFVDFEKIYIRVEPDHPKEMAEFLGEVALVLGDRVEITVNSFRLGTDKNGFLALRRAFEAGSDLNVHIEEDVILSSDALDVVLEEFPKMKAYTDPGCLCFCLHNHNSQAMSEDTIRQIQCIHEFNPYGWACTKEQWQFLSAEWFTNRWSPDGVQKYGWDWSVNYHCANAKTHYTAMPLVSRATTIGELGGVNMSPEQWRAEFANQIIAP